VNLSGTQSVGVAREANTRELIDSVNTGGSVLARVRSAFIDIGLTKKT
jgi:hypothetical protein